MMWVTRRVVLLLVVVAQVATRQGLVGVELSVTPTPPPTHYQNHHIKPFILVEVYISTIILP